MNWRELSVFMLVFVFVAERTSCQISLPNITIGDPNMAKYDVLGPPISKKELQMSLSLDVSEDLDPKKDPIGSSGYYEGDIVVESEDQLLQILDGDPEGQLSAIKNPHKLWPQSMIPYVISSSFNSQERALIARGMAEYHQRTCIRFVPRSSHRDYIHILRGNGCSSNVGRSGGVQYVSLGYGCVHFGVIIHELMPSAGFWHEQSRYDRDSYVSIYWNNIMPGLQFNFQKNSIAITTDLGLPYDYASIMHYGSYAFTRRYGSPTIVPKRSGVTIGQRKGFSPLDVDSLNMLYKCSGVKPGPGPKPKPGQCTDYHHHCQSWASLGYCQSNPGYMDTNCKKSCNKCGGQSCTDTGRYCVDWSAKGECQRNPAYMALYCKKSCNLCRGGGGGGGGGGRPCNDLNRFCQDWARRGECSRNAAFMNLSCKRSCGRC